MSLIKKSRANNNVDLVQINQVRFISTFIGQNSNMNGKHDGKKNLLIILAKIKSVGLLIRSYR